MAHSALIWIRQRWRLLFVILIPLLLLPLPILNTSPQSRCGYIVLILSSFWVFEVIPLPVTSLLPIVFFPMAGIIKAADVAPQYFQDIIALFFGSLSLAYAVESVNLHRRIALFVLSTVGSSAKWAMAGLMGVTAFLSMWINNSAATSIMLPVTLAICDELEHHGRNYQDKKHAMKGTTAAANGGLDFTETEVPNRYNTRERIIETFQIEEPTTDVSVVVQKRFRLPWRKQTPFNLVKPLENKYDDIKKGFLLAVAYSATIGGLSSLVGTAPNVFVKGYVDKNFAGTAFRINFLNFLLFALPVAVIMLVICWLWLQIFYNKKELFQCRVDSETRDAQADLKAMLLAQYKQLGKPNWSEGCVAIVFALTIILWVTKEFPNSNGWDVIFQHDYIRDGTVGIFCGVLPMILPNSNPFQSNWKYEPIIRWNDLVKNIAWGAIFLLGAGLTVAAAFKASGLSNSVAEALKFVTGIPRAAVIFIIIVISGLFTEVTSNLSTASIFLPVLDAVARSAGIHPAYLILPCTLAVSLAFMLPIATPPNAIIFGSGAIRVVDMIKTGVVMNIVGFLVIFLAATTWMPIIYGLDDRATEIFYSMNLSTVATVLKME